MVCCNDVLWCAVMMCCDDVLRCVEMCRDANAAEVEVLKNGDFEKRTLDIFHESKRLKNNFFTAVIPSVEISPPLQKSTELSHTLQQT